MLNAGILKKLMESIKDLITDANFDCSTTGVSLQAMDSAHVSLVALHLRAEGFNHYRADRNISLGISLASMSKILKCAGNDDLITLKAEDSAESMTFMFETPKHTRVSHFALKLMDIDSEHLGIPDTEYQCVVQMPAAEFQRIVREVQVIGDTVNITASKEGVKFQVVGDMGTGSIVCKSTPSVDDADAVVVKCEEEVSLTFALRYLNFFAKATPLSNTVILRMSPEVPLVTEYKIHEGKNEIGHIRFYLAPKIEDEEGGEEGASSAQSEPAETDD